MKKKVFEFENKKKRIIILSVIIAIVLITFYFNFFYYKKCKDITCFNTNLARCKRATFTNTQDDSVWFYAIRGTSKGKCVIYVKNIDMNIEEASQVRGKDMLCYLPKGIVMPPEADIDECHGLLKETLQDIIIKQLHVYIVQNLGEIREDIT